MKRWANGLPLSAIQGEMEGSAAGTPLQFTKVNLDTASFFPVLSVTQPASTVIIPKEAGGLYIFNFYAEKQPSNNGVDLIYIQVNGVDMTPRMRFVTYPRTAFGFDYLNPGDVVRPVIFPIDGGAGHLTQRYIFKLARLSV